MKRKNDIRKKNHFVPVSYLDRFADPAGFLYVFDQKSKQWRRQRPKEVMHQRHYYRQEWAPPGIDQDLLEKYVGESLENAAAKVIDRLINPPLELDDQVFANFVLYLEFQRIRVPRQIEMAKRLMRDRILLLGPPDVTRDVLGGKFRLEMKKSVGFIYLKEMMGQLNPWFARMKWEVIRADDGAAFITTDSPVSLWNAACFPPAEAGIGLLGTVVLFPLSSQYLLIMRHPEYNQNRRTLSLRVLAEPTLEDLLVPITTGGVWTRRTVANHNKVMRVLSDRLLVAQSRQVLEECM